MDTELNLGREGGRMIAKRIIVLFIVLAQLTAGYATEQKMAQANDQTNIVKFDLQLVAMKAIKTSERTDELFMAVTSYPSKGRSLHREVPAFPRYWLSSHLQGVQNVSLWKGQLKPDEKVTIHLSLVERDSPPFDTDDLVGTVLVKIKNSKGTLDIQWIKHGSKDTGKKASVANAIGARDFVLTGNNSEYAKTLAIINTGS